MFVLQCGHNSIDRPLRNARLAITVRDQPDIIRPFVRRDVLQSHIFQFLPRQSKFIFVGAGDDYIVNL